MFDKWEMEVLIRQLYQEYEMTEDDQDAVRVEALIDKVKRMGEKQAQMEAVLRAALVQKVSEFAYTGNLEGLNRLFEELELVSKRATLDEYTRAVRDVVAASRSLASWK